MFQSGSGFRFVFVVRTYLEKLKNALIRTKSALWSPRQKHRELSKIIACGNPYLRTVSTDQWRDLAAFFCTRSYVDLYADEGIYGETHNNKITRAIVDKVLLDVSLDLGVLLGFAVILSSLQDQ